MNTSVPGNLIEARFVSIADSTERDVCTTIELRWWNKLANTPFYLFYLKQNTSIPGSWTGIPIRVLYFWEYPLVRGKLS